MTNLAQNLTDTSRRYGDRTAINLDATDIAYPKLDDAPSGYKAHAKAPGSYVLAH